MGDLMKQRTRLARGAKHIPLILLAVFAAGPLFVLVTNSLKTRTELALSPIGMPSNPQFSNYVEAWQRSDFGLHAANSLILVFATVICVLLLAGPAAYSLARLEVPGGGMVLVYMLAVTAFPIWLYLVPLFFTWRTLGLLNSFAGLVIIYTAINSPLAIFLLRSFLIRIPKEIEEAAFVDGASKMQVLLRVILPIAWTGFLTVGLVVAVAVWGEFQIAFVMLQDEDKLPVTTSFYRFSESFGQDWSLTSAVAVLAIVPVCALFLIFQRRFTEGLTQGSIK
jgi:raffinose/stachyose/melibiose transport system permease protein